MGYGLGPYGFGPYGDVIASTTISVLAAWATSTHGVRVLLTGEPLHSDQFATGDALNSLTWSVVDVSGSRTLTVVAATMNDSTSLDLVTLEPLGDHLANHTVTAVGLLSIDVLALTSPDSASFVGVVQSVDPVDVTQGDFRDRDLANPPFSSARTFGAGGTLVISSDGDFETDTGQTLTRKLIVRRLSTKRGSFRHLPNYGISEIFEKEPLSGGQLITALRDIEDQCLQEPDVTNAVAQGTLDRQGILIIKLSVTSATGSGVTLRMGSRAGRLLEM